MGIEMKKIVAVGLASLAPAALMAAETSEAALSEVRELGKEWSGDVARGSYEIYGPMLQAQETGDTEVTRDISYGSHERNVLDVFAPEAAEGAPVVLYIHGGGMTGGDKQAESLGGAAYDNVGYYLAQNGIVGATMNYRLVPGASFPSGGEDVAAAVEWLRENTSRFGGNPDSIFTIGHSAGGTVLGEYFYAPEVQPEGGPDLAGAIFLSGATGSYGGRPETAAEYYGEDQALWDENSVQGLLDRYEGPLVPTMIVTAELDPVGIETSSIEHLQTLCDRLEGCPRFTQVPGHNHITTALSLNTGDESFGKPLRDFVHGVVDGEVWQAKD